MNPIAALALARYLTHEQTRPHVGHARRPSRTAALARRLAQRS